MYSREGHKMKNSYQYDTIPMEYAGILFLLCGNAILWYIAPTADRTLMLEIYAISIITIPILFSCLWHYRLDEQSVTKLHCGIRKRRLLWENVEQVGIIYIKGNAPKPMVIGRS